MISLGILLTVSSFLSALFTYSLSGYWSHIGSYTPLEACPGWVCFLFSWYQNDEKYKSGSCIYILISQSFSIILCYSKLFTYINNTRTIYLAIDRTFFSPLPREIPMICKALYENWIWGPFDILTERKIKSNFFHVLYKMRVLWRFSEIDVIWFIWYFFRVLFIFSSLQLFKTKK